MERLYIDFVLIAGSRATPGKARAPQDQIHALIGFDILAVRKSRLLHAVELLNEKTLLLATTLLREDYSHLLQLEMIRTEALNHIRYSAHLEIYFFYARPTDLPNKSIPPTGLYKIEKAPTITHCSGC